MLLRLTLNMILLTGIEQNVLLNIIIRNDFFSKQIGTKFGHGPHSLNKYLSNCIPLIKISTVNRFQSMVDQPLIFFINGMLFDNYLLTALTTLFVKISILMAN